MCEYLGTIFFVNRTASMPRGIYIKTNEKKLNKGDIIVFNSSQFNGKLIKYILAIPEAEFCLDEKGTLWVDNIPSAQRNIKKYSSSINEQSVCQHLESDEILVIGEHPESYDSRYFGAVKKNGIIATVKLILPFKE
jgi:signal peptidase I